MHKIANGWHNTLKKQGLLDFSALWNLPGTLVEEGNIGRGGNSQVKSITARDPQGNNITIFVKCQENYFTRSWHSPLRGEPVCRREFRHLSYGEQHGLSVAKPLLYLEQKRAGKYRAILVTHEISDQRPLLDVLTSWQQTAPTLSLRRKSTRNIAHTLKHLHDLGLQHRALYAKHIFLSADGSKVTLLDFEKAKQRSTRQDIGIHDLETLFARTSQLRLTDCMAFLKYYLPENDKAARKKLWQYISKRHAKRRQGTTR